MSSSSYLVVLLAFAILCVAIPAYAGFCDDMGRSGLFCDGDELKSCVHKCKIKDGKEKCEYDKVSEVTCTYGCEQQFTTRARCKDEPCKIPSWSGASNTFCSTVVQYRTPETYMKSNNATSEHSKEAEFFYDTNFIDAINPFEGNNVTECRNDMREFSCRTQFPECVGEESNRMTVKKCMEKCASSVYCGKAMDESGEFTLTLEHCGALCNAGASIVGNPYLMAGTTILASLFMLFL